ncbi:hypothetical protein [Mycolicibacterium sp. 018/SC-01/001]|uniref:hypothetical protein n=1 Tax=Mycolicibacterium sp. 018/SC-01/001 TaxID=2592069 RepID=UPI00351A8E96
MPSACPGWRCIDIIAHLGALSRKRSILPHPTPPFRATASGITMSASTNAGRGVTSRSSTSGGPTPLLSWRVSRPARITLGPRSQSTFPAWVRFTVTCWRT